MFAPHYQVDKVSRWRRNRYRRAFLLLASYLIPDRRLRSIAGRLLRQIPWVAEFARFRLGMIFFDRIVVPKFTKDVSELRTYGQDIRALLADVQPLMAEQAYTLQYNLEKRPLAPYGRGGR